MEIQVLVFGQLTEIIGKTQLSIQDVADTDALNLKMQQRFPGLKELKYFIAINHELVRGNTTLTETMTVAFMPPFSGG
ncbi:MoaD/ThiS family protein [Pedobacter sp. AW31-3R]|uniref:MoaD/ThiS family protein n=1 Tax=Pedobacter sp. AW31-3R TaxID=3445781 RepID=UPI003F9F9331